jgi:hypothetical protein
MSSKTSEAMVRLHDASPFEMSDIAASLPPAELDVLYASIPRSPRAPQKRRWASLSVPRRTAIVALLVGVVGAGGGLAAAASLSTSSKPHFLEPTYSQAQRRAIYANELKLATCMHSHGYPTFPTPNPHLGNGKTPVLTIGGPNGGNIDVLSPGVQAALKECSGGMQKVPGNLGAKAFPPGTRRPAGTP